ncbi:RNB-domain-containing protein [Tuber magnatum]|uniref:RNB-domain-containing protein n=1 Tax=Tuber magnatum TaxID=42249 RepID=A0A317SYZ6_9PEZI|nr:RNB-domain-containing protein [Tuber magnatum]
MGDIPRQEADPGDIAAPRSVTGDILEPVRQFGAAAASLYAEHRPAFDGLYAKWADETEERKITLFEAAEMAFGVGCDQDPNYNAMLYAMHTALMGDGLHFMGDRGMHRATNVFRVRSKREIRMIDFVTKLIRKTADEQQSTDKSGQKAAEVTGRKIMAKFIEKANYLIDLSREYEKEVLVGRKKGAPFVETEEIEELKWDENDKFFIEYVKARVLKYGLQKTPIDGLAPVILKATNRYGEVLDALTADTFLREIGAWSKWENTSLHQSDLDLPGLGRSELGDKDENRFQDLDRVGAIKELGFTDVMHNVRKDWGDLEVFTIDDPDAYEIDDGVSLQRVSDTENWVHVHIANPTAFIPEDHWITEIAKRRATSHYLPDKVYKMLPGAITGVFLGVAPNKPVMSISIKVNDNGEILDYNIQAGFVRKVKRTTYDAVDLALGSYKTIKFNVDLRIGGFPKNPGVAPGPGEFTPHQVRDLRKLRDIALAVRRRRTRDGLIAASSVIPQVEVDNGLGSQNHPYHSSYPVLYRGHPAVRLTVADSMDVEYRDSQLMVSEMMSLANNVASIWSRERDLAMPYRVMEYDYRRPDVVKAIEETVLPRRTDLGCPPFESTIRWLMLLGQTRLQARPGPHMLMGLPTGYAKTTSPLRRYSDMLAQYQIQSVLLEQSPKTTAQLEPILASTQRTERTAKHISKEASRFWSAVAIKHAWETGLEKHKFPKKLSFLVMEKHSFPTPCNGLVRELGLVGKMCFADRRDEDKVRVGDVVGVKICDVKLSERYVWFEFTGVVEVPALGV